MTFKDRSHNFSIYLKTDDGIQLIKSCFCNSALELLPFVIIFVFDITKSNMKSYHGNQIVNSWSLNNIRDTTSSIGE